MLTISNKSSSLIVCTGIAVCCYHGDFLLCWILFVLIVPLIARLPGKNYKHNNTIDTTTSIANLVI